jgi:hypothetical protein
MTRSAVPEHAIHIGTLLGPALLLAFWAGWSDLRAWMHRQGDALAPTALLVAAALSAGAGAVHALVGPAHVREDLLYGAFFVVAASAQLCWALIVVVRPDPRVLFAGIVGNAGIVLLWAATRTFGIPLGVAAGRREAVGVLDLTCAALELALIACCARTLATDRQTAACAPTTSISRLRADDSVALTIPSRTPAPSSSSRDR